MADVTNLGLGGVQNPFMGVDNPYLQNAIDLSSRDLVNNYNRTVLPAQNAAAIRSGSFGNSGLDEMNMAQQQQLQTSLGDLSSKLRFNDYQTQAGLFNNQRDFGEGQRQFNLGFGRNVFNDAYSQNMNNLQTGIGLLGTLGGYNATDINNATTQQNAPMTYWQQFSNGASALGNGGTTTTQQGTSSNPFMSAIGGAQLGNQAMNWWNQNNGSGITGTGGASGMANYGNTPSTNYFGSGFL